MFAGISAWFDLDIPSHDRKVFSLVMKKANGLSTLCGLLILLLVGAAPAFGADFGRQMIETPGKVHLVIPTDVNGDGRLDLVVSHTVGEKPKARAFVAVFLAKAEGYSASPDVNLEVPTDACLFDVADLDGDGAQEVVILRKWQVQSHALQPGAAGGWETLISRGTGVLFPSAHGRLPYSDFARDWTGDGTVEIMVPDYGVLQFFKANGSGKWDANGKVTIKTEGWMSVTNRTSAEEAGEQIESGMYLPRMFAADSRDGRELVLTFGEEVWLHPRQNGRFAEKGNRFFLPVLTEAQRREENSNVTTIVDDLNGDGYPDLAMLKVGGTITNFRSTVRIYAGQSGGFQNQPAYSLDRDGFFPSLRFWDLDGDGKKEMMLPIVEVGLVQIARVFLTQTLRLKTQVFRGGANFYGKDSHFSREIVMKVATDRGISFHGYPPNFNGDFDADGRPDLLMSHGDGFAVWRNQGNLSFGAAPLLSAAVEAWEFVRLADLNGDQKCDLVEWDRNIPDRRTKIMVLFNRH
jgi:hypothetical protein